MKMTIGALLVALVVGAAAVGPIMSMVEQPNYNVLVSKGKIEIRTYQSMMIAEVQVNGQRYDSINSGFSLLADYIFGNNKVQEKIKMTSPVEQQASSKIAMTAPVEQQKENDSWKINFIMPKKYKMDTLPLPVNDRVKIKEIPSKQYVAIKFSGRNSNSNIEEHEKKLLDYIKEKNLKVKPVPKYAFYNPPWTLPILRRNEVMFELIEFKP